MQPIDARLSGPPQRTKANGIPVAQPMRAQPPAKNMQLQEFQLKKAIEAANLALKEVTSDLEFAQDPATGKTVIRVIDAGTRQVIRQFPSEELLAIARAIDQFQGLLLREKA